MMNDIKLNAICLKAVNYNDNDKLLSLYTAELGRITAVIKGIKKPNAKLKFSAEPFHFGEYILTKKSDRYCVINCNSIESFYSIREDIVIYYCGTVILDVLLHTGNDNAPNAKLLVTALKALNQLSDTDVNSYVVIVKYLLNSLQLLGYKLSFESCNNCGTSNMSTVYFDSSQGGVVCSSCRSAYANTLQPSTYSSLKIIDSTSVERLNVVKIPKQMLISCLSTLGGYYKECLSSLTSIVQLAEM